jgi:hypothetical protein
MRDITDVHLAETKNAKVETLLSDVRDYADYFIGEVLVAGKPTKKTAARLDAAAVEGEPLLGGDAFKATILKKQTAANLAYDLPAGQTAPRRPFHWAIEFPEVFANGGFDAICGNPPFMGGQHITGNFGTVYRDYSVNYLADGAKGSADLVAYFYLRSYSLLRTGGCFGLIACNTIAEGATRQVGLERMVKAGGAIYSSYPNMPWPGTAGVAISPVFMCRGGWHGTIHLGGESVEVISPFLSAQNEWTPQNLVANTNQSFQGSIVLGMGFTMSEKDARTLIEKDPKNADVLFPYLNGEDLNSDPLQRPSRWVINFFDWPIARAKEYEDIFPIVEEKVKPERERNKDKIAHDFWWRFLRSRSELYHAIGRGASFEKHPEGWSDNSDKMLRVLACSGVSKYLIFSQCPSDVVFSHATFVFIIAQQFTILQSNIHESWARKQSSSLESRMRYTPATCYETFPFPLSPLPQLESIGEQFDTLRRQIMVSRNIGLTALYNLFHNPAEKDAELEEMRKLQREIDEAVCDAYGWSDIDLGHGFHEVGYLPANDNVRYTISEPARIEILKRLSALNRQRWEEEEAAGLHKKGKK